MFASSAGSTGSGAITVSHFGHSVLPISIATGPPSVIAVPHPGEHRDLVLLELHPRAAAVAQPAAGELAGDLVGRDLDPGDHALDHGHQRAAVGFTSGGPSQHASHLPTAHFSCGNPQAIHSRDFIHRLGVELGVVRSEIAARFECMFDGSLPEIADLASLSDAALVDAAGGWARAENAACARKLAVMAEMFARRTGLAAGERELWWVDPQAAVAAEMAAAVNVSQGMALHQTHRGVALRDRLPKVAALFAAGVISDLLVRTIVWRTYLIADEEAMAAVDCGAGRPDHRLGCVVGGQNRGGHRRAGRGVSTRARCAARASRRRAATVQFGSPTDVAGTTSMWARLYAADAALIEQRVEELARSVCDADPRTLDERRADALTAAGHPHRTACACGEADCAPAPPRDRAGQERRGLRGRRREIRRCRHHCRQRRVRADVVDPRTRAGAAGVRVRRRGTAHRTAGRHPGARAIREVRHPGDTPPDPRYTPTRATAEFVRCRDLTCRFPGCDKPAQFCDLDHTVPYPVGPDPPVKPQVSVPLSPLAENVLERRDGLAGPTTARRHHRVDLTDRAHLHHLSGQPAPVPDNCVNPPPRCGPANHQPSSPPTTAA